VAKYLVARLLTDFTPERLGSPDRGSGDLEYIGGWDIIFLTLGFYIEDATLSSVFVCFRKASFAPPLRLPQMWKLTTGKGLRPSEAL